MPELSLTIVFRGLMVFHQQGNVLEVGVLKQTHAPNHNLRINVYRNGVPDGVMPLPTALVDATNRNWDIQINHPIGSGVKRFTDGSASFDRKDDDNTHHEDFRWIMDIEKPEFFGPLGNKIDTAGLRPIIRIPHGRIYNRLKSQKLNRQKGTGSIDPFGRVSEAIACDIRLQGNSTGALLTPSGGTPIFPFDVGEPNVIYEIANTPPDPVTLPLPPFQDHFQHYYHILDSSLPKFAFSLPGLAPAPRPALCGEVFLGTRNTSLS